MQLVLLIDEPLDDPFGDETDHAKGKTKKNDKGTKFSSFRLPSQLPNDEQHVEHER